MIAVYRKAPLILMRESESDRFDAIVIMSQVIGIHAAENTVSEPHPNRWALQTVHQEQRVTLLAGGKSRRTS